jgi:hypothetical protein
LESAEGNKPAYDLNDNQLKAFAAKAARVEELFKANSPLVQKQVVHLNYGPQAGLDKVALAYDGTIFVREDPVGNLMANPNQKPTYHLVTPNYNP